MKILKQKTKSLCPKCLKELDAKVSEENGNVYLSKKCPEHGKFHILVEKDASFYKKVMNREFKKEPLFNKLDLPVSFSCNLNCNVCYAPKRNIEEIPSDELKETIRSFDGTYVSLAGGEPTMRDDLLDIIRFTIKNKKIPVLVTNGIKLADMSYVKNLEDAGLRLVNFSFNGFDDKIYEKLNGKKMLDLKLKALNNLKKTRILTGISMMIERGLNEEEIQKAIDYCLANNPSIYELRIKSSNIVGRHIRSSIYHTSELLDFLCKNINKKKDILYDKLNTQNTVHSVCRFSLDLYYCKNNRNASLVFADVNIKGKDSRKDALPVRVAKVRFALDYARKLKIDRLYLWAVLFKNIPLKDYVKILAKTLVTGGEIAKLRVEIRSWPNKYSADLMEISQCPVLRLNEDKKKLPFCYSLLIDERTER
jgi:MoaA/NifB/PqqE/SkfB family radical SAM enzyme